MTMLHESRKKARFMTGRRRPGWAGGYHALDGFDCLHCHAYVDTAYNLAGVHNRNHCPYCLWSRHLDLSTPGDRLSACKAGMQPIGLTLKKTRKKYGPGQGELMLIHLCAGCGSLSINRIAADDDPQTVWGVFRDLSGPVTWVRDRLAQSGITALEAGDIELVQLQLFGGRPDLDGYSPAWA
jgi:hypothetical protein